MQPPLTSPGKSGSFWLHKAYVNVDLGKFILDMMIEQGREIIRQIAASTADTPVLMINQNKYKRKVCRR